MGTTQYEKLYGKEDAWLELKAEEEIRKAHELMETQLITNFEEYIKEANNLAKESEWIKIITFGIYEGDQISEFFSNHKNKNIEVIISYFFKQCYPGCEHCIRKAEGTKKHYNTLIQNHPSIKFKFITESHAKLFITESGALIGGMNFTESKWDDFVIRVNNNTAHYDALLNFFSNIKKSKNSLNSFDGVEDNILDFGKYKGFLLGDVLKKDKPYLRWAYKNMEGFKEKYGLKKEDLWLIEKVE